ncbi:hypothetical protein BpHYR1_012367 [Brachionus plicatilis]|uniref:Uncharacterized protein n=1 Tax=Brachionus plicatilis TaxID=10195 RepID=A0A3M7S1W4_BRAPC|nr:hypothetical protein BpHYR1_012367 [Brachionus plicatilis]
MMVLIFFFDYLEFLLKKLFKSFVANFVKNYQFEPKNWSWIFGKDLSLFFQLEVKNNVFFSCEISMQYGIIRWKTLKSYLSRTAFQIYLNIIDYIKENYSNANVGLSSKYVVTKNEEVDSTTMILIMKLSTSKKKCIFW